MKLILLGIGLLLSVAVVVWGVKGLLDDILGKGHPDE